MCCERNPLGVGGTQSIPLVLYALPLLCMAANDSIHTRRQWAANEHNALYVWWVRRCWCWNAREWDKYIYACVCMCMCVLCVCNIEIYIQYRSCPALSCAFPLFCFLENVISMCLVFSYMKNTGFHIHKPLLMIAISTYSNRCTWI